MIVKTISKDNTSKKSALKRKGGTIHGALHPAARHPANKATVLGIQSLAEGDLE